MCGKGGPLSLGLRNMWSVQGPASSLNCPAILVLEFQSLENESPVALPWGGPSASCLMFTIQVDINLLVTLYLYMYNNV